MRGEWAVSLSSRPPENLRHVTPEIVGSGGVVTTSVDIVVDDSWGCHKRLRLRPTTSSGLKCKDSERWDLVLYKQHRGVPVATVTCWSPNLGGGTFENDDCVYMGGCLGLRWCGWGFTC